MKRFFTGLLAAWAIAVGAAEVIPPPPAAYFNDYANVVTPATAQRLNQTLENFERESSSQIVVAVFPKMLSDSSIEDYTVRVAQSWKVGQKAKDNGAVLFVFIQDRKMYIQVGYGLEGVLPDARCKQIIENEIKPSFRNGNYEAGLSAGLTAMLAAAKGEYKGNGRTVDDARMGSGASPLAMFIFLIFLFLIIWMMSRRRGRYYRSGGWTSGGWGGGWGGGGGGWSGGGGSGGGFSGGGGSFGGGGAGGSW